MKIMHLSDLHLGKRVNEFSMIEDQKYILDEIIKILNEEAPDAVIIAGDVYDKSVPTAEAVSLFDVFLSNLADKELSVFVISGNHDSPERIAFASDIMSKSGMYFSHVYDGNVEKVQLSDEYGLVNFYLLPFIKPVNVKRFYPDEDIDSYTDAVKTALSSAEINDGERNILITHQFVAGAGRCESEELSLGGSDAVDVSAFDNFDYVALGHIHGPQKVGRDNVRYCGTPLKYSFSEANHKKSVTLLELGAKGNISIRCIPLVPLHDMREIRGRYEDVASKKFYEGTDTGDYLHITLTDEDDIPDAIAKLRAIYPNIMRLDYDNARTRENREISIDTNIEKRTPTELFSQFYEVRNNKQMTDEQTRYIENIIKKLWEGEN
ncbi:MAG: exonuclease SbcCD subunit D [Clostridia bacterium]|nr:exonuclease SbcCD subunit D [Clostridia bacterium]